jgi:hypothetical protein
MLAIVELEELVHLTELLEQLRLHCHHRLLSGVSELSHAAIA